MDKHAVETPLVTERLVLTPLGPGDAERLYEYRSDERVTRFQLFHPAHVSDAAAFIAETMSDEGCWLQLGIRSRESGDLLGDLGIRFPGDESGEVEIGATVAPEHQGQGIGTEAARAVLATLFRVGIRRVVASVEPENAASIAAARTRRAAARCKGRGRG